MTQQPLKKQTIIETLGQHINLTADFLLTRQPNAPCFIFFADPHFLKNNFSQPHKWHIWFCPDTQSQRFAKPKEPLFSQRTKEDYSEIRANFTDIN